MLDKQSPEAVSDRDGVSKKSKQSNKTMQAGQGARDESIKIEVGMVEEAVEGDPGQENISKAKIIDIVYDQDGGLEEKQHQHAQKPDDVVESTDAASVAQGVIDDHVDIQNAQGDNREQPSSKRKPLLRIGPGLITGVADDDPSGIGTYSVAGAQFGYLLLWLVPVCVPLMIAVQEMCGRV